MADEDEWAEFRRTVEALEAELASHPGTAAYHRVDDLLRAWDVVDAAGRDLYALVMAGQEDRAFAVALIDWRGTGRDAFVKAADKALQGLVAALGALVDVSRRTVNKEPPELRAQYQVRVAELTTTNQAAAFLKGLRNYLLHAGHAPWRATGTFGGETATATVTLVTSQLLSWDGWSSATRRWLEQQEYVELGPLVKGYRDDLRQLYVWLVEAMQTVHAEEIAGANDVIRRRNLALTGGAFETQQEFMAAVTRGVAEWRAEHPTEGETH